MTCSRGCERGHNRQVETGGGGDPGGRVAAAAAELYGVEAEAFTDRRKALAAAAKAAGDPSAAAAIAALRKPTRAAWVVNRLARADADAPRRLATMAASLRAAERAKDGPRLRELSSARGALIDALTGQALAAAGLPDPPPSLRAEVEATLTAALADPQVGAAFAAGTLTRAVHWSGFGDASPAGFGPGDPVPAPAISRPSRTVARPSAGGQRETATRGPSRRGPQAPAAPVPVAARAAATEEAQRLARQAAERAAADDAERLAREAAERGARQRKIYAEAERTVAAAATATAAALAGEDALEAEVRKLEEGLTRARTGLAAARLSARRAEAAERRARQALDRLGRPGRPGDSLA